MREYANSGILFLNLRFENSVNSYRSETLIEISKRAGLFENSVNSYSSETHKKVLLQAGSLRIV